MGAEFALDVDSVVSREKSSSPFLGFPYDSNTEYETRGNAFWKVGFRRGYTSRLYVEWKGSFSSSLIFYGYIRLERMTANADAIEFVVSPSRRLRMKRRVRNKRDEINFPHGSLR